VTLISKPFVAALVLLPLAYSSLLQYAHHLIST